jgi:hypothetical protein
MKEENDLLDIDVFENFIQSETDLSSLFETLLNEDPSTFLNIQQTTSDDLSALEANISEQKIADKLPDLEASNRNKRKLSCETSDGLLLLDSSIGQQQKRRSTRKRTIKSLSDEYCSSSSSSSSSTATASATTKSNLEANEPVVAKKESNKEAATRYRLKKINEKDNLFETKDELEKQNEDVRRKINNIQTEIDYLKVVLVQMLATKGLINASSLTIS